MCGCCYSQCIQYFNVDEKTADGPRVHLNGSDENGHVLQGQDAVYENNKQWHDTAFPSYLQSKKDDFCLNWEEAMQVWLLAVVA